MDKEIFIDSKVSEVMVNSEISEVVVNSEVSEVMANSEVSKVKVDPEVSKIKVDSEVSKVKVDSEVSEVMTSSQHNLPLVCLTEDISKLHLQYEQDIEIKYRIKIMVLELKCNKIRRFRNDGNSFYRAFAFAWFEQLTDSSRDQTLRHSAINSLAAINSLLSSAYQSFVYRDVHDIVEKQVKAIANGEYDENMLLTIFQTDEISNYIVYYFRLIAAAYLKLHRREYESLLEFNIGMDQFCTKFVEVMDIEADKVDDLYAIALTKALKVPVEIGYLNGSDMMELVRKFYPHNGSVLKPLTLLYHSGHYDILY
ncbi:peptidase C65 Otubain-domain-containing protein [Glomus cerebriforme]|uniref:ubiquitinyl hydrolase 1 n=1 Tax=Glomus cerebriforme TaxID=658196 RepID=A0A397T982_9GLOM|nr:peptidase C65 Otubain-domain-containing protein [Glomus cerebriforme]